MRRTMTRSERRGQPNHRLGRIGHHRAAINTQGHPRQWPRRSSLWSAPDEHRNVSPAVAVQNGGVICDGMLGAWLECFNTIRFYSYGERSSQEHYNPWAPCSDCEAALRGIRTQHFTPYAVELVCYDLRSDANHTITLGIARDTPCAKRAAASHEQRKASADKALGKIHVQEDRSK